MIEIWAEIHVHWYLYFCEHLFFVGVISSVHGTDCLRPAFLSCVDGSPENPFSSTSRITTGLLARSVSLLRELAQTKMGGRTLQYPAIHRLLPVRLGQSQLHASPHFPIHSHPTWATDFLVTVIETPQASPVLVTSFVEQRSFVVGTSPRWFVEAI